MAEIYIELIAFWLVLNSMLLFSRLLACLPDFNGKK
jgi:hypothetical protein